MINLHALRLKDVGVHKDTTIEDLNKQEFVVINGLNLDSPDVANNANGAGKSMLFGALPTLLFEADPLAMSKNSKGSFLGAKGQIEAEWQSPTGDVIKVVQTKSKYQVFMNGKDMKTNIQDVARNEWIKKHFPISKDEFYSYCYIQTQIPHPFQRKTPADRLKYFTSVFNLDIYDRLRAHFKSKLNDSDHAQSEAKGLADILDVNERKRKRLKVNSAVRTELEELTAELEVMHDELDHTYEKVTDLKSEATIAKSREALEAQLAALGIEDDKPKATIKKLKKRLAQIDAYEEYVLDMSQYKERSAELVKAVARLEREYCGLTPKQIAKRHEDLSHQRDVIENRIEDYEGSKIRYQRYRTELKDAKAERDEHEPTKRTLDDIEEAMADKRLIVTTYESLCDHDAEDDTCPTCGSKLDMAKLEKSAKKAAKAYKQLVSNKKWLKANAEYEELKANPVEKPTPLKEKVFKKYDDLGTELEQLELQYDIAERLAKAQSRLDKLSKPKKIEKPKFKRKPTERKLDELEDYVQIKAALKSVGEASGSYEQLHAKVLKMDEKVSKMRKKISRKTIEHADLSDRVRESDFYREQIKEVKAKLAKLEPMIAKREVFETMFKAYGTTLKLQAIEGLLKQIENSLNKYSHLVFPEGMKFELGTSARGISATVTRLASNNTTDIAQMSGAETNCFRLLFAIAILPFVPEHRRADFIVLDEPEASCSPAVRQHIIDNFLPIIRSVVPNVYWITPLDVESLGHPPVWTIVKKDGKSTLKESKM